MTHVTVTTQAELDAALNDPNVAYDNTEIFLDAPAGVTLVVDDGRGHRVTADWTIDALCASIDGDLWYTDPEGAGTGMEGRTAIRICGDCPVQAQCLHAAMRLEQGMGRKSRFGIWGGLTPTQRATLDHTRREGPTA